MNKLNNRLHQAVQLLVAESGKELPVCATRRRWLLMLLLLTLPAAVQAQFNYTIDNGTITITGYTGPDGAVVIPATIDGYPVTSIGDSAFYASGLSSVTIPNSVTTIENSAFSSCKSMTNVTIGSGVISIGDYAFSGASHLTSITIPNSVATIGDGAFISCYSLTSVTIGNGVTSIGRYAFSSDEGLTSVTIPNSVTSIGDGALSDCTGLTSVTIGNGVTGIGFSAFEGCTSLTSVTIPKSVTGIAYGAFFRCTSLSAITVDALNSFYSSVDGALFDKSQSQLVQYPEGKAGSAYTIPNSVTSIGDGAFHWCTSLPGITIPNSVTSIGNNAFTYCYSLTSVTIGNSVSSIGSYAFQSCTSLTNVMIPINVTTIGDRAFAYCTNLIGIYFQGNAPGIDSGIFNGANNAIVYYLPGTTGWGTPFGGRPAVLWNPLAQTSGPTFGVGPSGFGFNITGTAGIPIVVEACTNLANASWVPLQSLNLTNGAFYFSDPNWTNYPARNYRIRSP